MHLKYLKGWFSLFIIAVSGASCTSKPAQNKNVAAQGSTTAKPARLPSAKANPMAKKDLVSVTANQLIIPGKAIGETYIGEDMKAVFERLGKPDAGDAAMGKSMCTWYARHEAGGYQTSVFASRDMGKPDETTSRAQQILVTSPFFKTADGIQTGISYRQISTRYTLKKASTFGKGARQLTVYDDKAKGIAFEFNPERLCSGIIVHKPGADGGVAYSAFHPETPPNPPRRGGL